MRVKLRTRSFFRWLGVLWRRINDDNMTVQAGNLTFVSLLGLVPFVTVIFAIFSAFPVFSDVSSEIRHFIFRNFVPATGNVIEEYIDRFVVNVHRMTVFGAIGLIVTSLLLMFSIDSALNSIWRSSRKRPLVFSFAVYWMILTLGPLLAGASIALSSYLLSPQWLNMPGISEIIQLVLRGFPLLLSWLAFWLLFSVVPTCSVAGRDALIGALVAGVLFEIGKKVFTLYVTMFPAYQLIYGVLAVIPMLFLWVYWTWCIVLLGAEITVSLEHYRKLRRQRQQQADIS
ncbi:virulence factor BrkB family protein [Tatumella sp. TA1]|uniref:virulence factor BrkB family protein n=1 Tax=Rosenbergiella collisarenosi TaxID=1544695 RepID=UPI0008F8A165|nr:virulence factor BrkB family protein [Rosenbergiella collisarenosi]MBT0721729.1 virulence factor BrkB family protein [Rosenbergiella collisarenosi]QGX92867.1 virulence factor BrkB family protein [Tatumella sp. TA1]